LSIPEVDEAGSMEESIDEIVQLCAKSGT